MRIGPTVEDAISLAVMLHRGARYPPWSRSHSSFTLCVVMLNCGRRMAPATCSAALMAGQYCPRWGRSARHGTRQVTTGPPVTRTGSEVPELCRPPRQRLHTRLADRAFVFHRRPRPCACQLAQLPHHRGPVNRLGRAPPQLQPPPHEHRRTRRAMPRQWSRPGEGAFLHH